MDPSEALSTVKGYLLALTGTELTARNVSSMYQMSRYENQPVELVHAEPILPPPGVKPRVLLSSGNTLLVESGSSGSVGGCTLKLYSSGLPYDPPVPPTWPQYVMGAAVIGITVCWQLYKRKSKSSGDDEVGGRRGGRSGGGRDNLGRRPGQGHERGASEAHFAAHLNYGRGGGGDAHGRDRPPRGYDQPPSMSSYERGGGGYFGGRDDDDDSD